MIGENAAWLVAMCRVVGAAGRAEAGRAEVGRAEGRHSTCGATARRSGIEGWTAQPDDECAGEQCTKLEVRLEDFGASDEGRFGCC